VDFVRDVKSVISDLRWNVMEFLKTLLNDLQTKKHYLTIFDSMDCYNTLILKSKSSISSRYSYLLTSNHIIKMFS